MATLNDPQQIVILILMFFISHKTLLHKTNTTTVPLIAGKDTKSASSHNEFNTNGYRLYQSSVGLS